MELVGQARSSAGDCKLTRSLSQLQARPPHLQAYCLCAFRALARSLIPAETSVSAKDFRPYSKIASEPMGVGPCNQSIASGFGTAEIKISFWRFLTFFGLPAAPLRALARVEAALARRSDHPGFARRFGSV